GVVLDGVPQVGDDRNQATAGLARQLGGSQKVATAPSWPGLKPFLVHTVINGYHFPGCRAFSDEMPAHGLRVGHNGVSEAKGTALQPLLGAAAQTFGLPSRGDPDRHARQSGRSHPEDVGIEVVGVHDLDATLAQETSEATQLADRVVIIKTGQGKFWNVAEI